MPRTPLPGDEDDFDAAVEGFLRLAKEHGDDAVFRMIRALRVNRGDGDIGARVMHLLAVRMVAHTDGDYDEARRIVAADLGYRPARRGIGGSTFTNFYKILNPAGRKGLVPDDRASSKYRHTGKTG